MKLSTVSIFFFLTMSPLAHADGDALDSAVVNAVLQNYGQTMAAADINSLPSAIVCGDTEIDTNSKDNTAPTTDKAKQGVVFDFTDGDQVHGVFFMKSDLVDLANRKVKSIHAKAYDGFWWSDGDHYSFTDTTCTAK